MVFACTVAALCFTYPWLVTAWLLAGLSLCRRHSKPAEQTNCLSSGDEDEFLCVALFLFILIFFSSHHSAALPHHSHSLMHSLAGQKVSLVLLNMTKAT